MSLTIFKMYVFPNIIKKILQAFLTNFILKKKVKNGHLSENRAIFYKRIIR